MNKKISVCISVYYKDNPEFVSLAFYSIIQQTVVPDEIIVVIDGPIPQNLSSVVTDFADRYN